MAWKRPFGWAAIVAANVVCLCVLNFYQTSHAEPNEDNLPFANAVQQRFEIINQIKETNALLKEQNSLLRSGKLRVVIDHK